MARVLIVGCGCRGQSLARALGARGYAVRGTTRDPARFEPIREAGAEPHRGDPDRIVTLMPALEGTAVLCWLMGSAAGTPREQDELQSSRLGMMLEKVVDTGVRGVVHEAAGTAGAHALARGRAVAERARDTWHIPLAVVTADPAAHGLWREAMVEAVEAVLGTRR
jgi:nucleoside-diphosphate-sugar epimerase